MARSEQDHAVSDAVTVEELKRRIARLDERACLYAEEAERLAVSEARYRRMVETAIEGIWELDPAGVTVYANPAMADMLGYTVDEMVGRPLTEFVFPEDREQVLAYREARRRGVSETLELRYRRRDGSELWARVSTGPVLDESGRFGGAIGLFTEVAELRQWRDRLTEANRRLNGLIAGVNAIVFEADARTWSFTYVSPQAESILGYPVEAWYRDGFWMDRLVHPDDREGAAAEVARGIETGRDHEVEYRAVRADGRVMWLRDIMHLSRDEAGEVARIRGLMVDVTDRKRLEADLRGARNEAQAASRAKDQFLSTISHELRTPLSAILGFASLLRDGVPGPVNELQRDQLSRIQAGARHLVEIIDDILTFSRSEAGILELDLTRCDLTALARDVVGLLEKEAAAAGLGLRLVEPSRPAVVETDARKVRQILTNLVGNAIKYTDHGSVEVELESRPGGPAIRVRDTGPGIPADRIDDIFQPFLQLDQSRTRERGGTGLGLSICQRLAEALGARLTVASEPGTGSTFTLELSVPGGRHQTGPSTRLGRGEAATP